eukprot:scaffold182405_cov29-Tisochrysis_lutea.AAC.5
MHPPRDTARPPGRSTIIKKTVSPVWNETFEWNGVLRDLLDDGLILTVYDHDKVRSRRTTRGATYDTHNALPESTLTRLCPSVIHW